MEESLYLDKDISLQCGLCGSEAHSQKKVLASSAVKSASLCMFVNGWQGWHLFWLEKCVKLNKWGNNLSLHTANLIEVRSSGSCGLCPNSLESVFKKKTKKKLKWLVWGLRGIQIYKHMGQETANHDTGRKWCGNMVKKLNWGKDKEHVCIQYSMFFEEIIFQIPVCCY